MPLFSEAASAIKHRFRFQDSKNNPQTSSSSELTATMPPSVKSTPDLFFKSATKEPPASLSIRSFSDGDDNYNQAPPSNSTTTTTRSFEFHEDPSFWKDHNVQVIIRVRPLSSSELSLQGQNLCVKQDTSQSITWIGNPESRFTFDHVADEHVTQEMMFKVSGVPMVENCVGGYNSCMFAYGQTGSGKTHTMLGDIEEGTRRHSVNCGMTPRVFEYLFSRIQKEKEARREEKIKFTCKCSFLEIYNEQILDLLDPSSANLQIREDTKKGVYVDNLTEVEVSSARDVMQQLVQGAANRKVASTNMNRASSRSHSVFTCVIESKWESQGVTHYRFSRLNMVDLAGSERQKSSGAEGERLKEATNINKSLSTLGLVIMNLVNMSNGKSLHVPYRDSKLTFLLQDSLGGNAKTIIIANISPSICCSLETLSTLKFAQRAKFIKNHAIINEDASGDVLAMRAQIQNLKKEVARLRMVNGGGENHEGGEIGMVTPGPFKFEPSTPITSHKRMSQNEYEVALVGAFRRENDKDITIQSLSAENQAAIQLAKQREDEIQGLKLRLKFREAGIKRLEGVVSGKITAETHLLQEKEELLKELEVLRTQDRTQEVTRFAMENLRYREEIRRLKSFYEEGERERMSEQIAALQNKLLEALDWKLMHESDPSNASGSPWRTSNNEENEFLRMQAIHNQSELETLRKKFDFIVEEKEKLERQVKDLVSELEAKTQHNTQTALTNNEMPRHHNIGDQMELQTMVNAIATASQREAEAHETAIMLSKENDALRIKLKVLIEDNNKLIELYERAISENQLETQNSQEVALVKDDNHEESLKQELVDLHEENDKLMELYEKAMQERDEFKRQLSITSSSSDKIESKVQNICLMDESCLNEVNVLEDRSLIKQKLVKAKEKLLTCVESMNLLSTLERAIVEIDLLSKEIKSLEDGFHVKEKNYNSFKIDSEELIKRKAMLDKKLIAVKYSLSKFSSSVGLFKQRETQAKTWIDSSLVCLNQKRDELSCLEIRKEEIIDGLRKVKQVEVDLRSNLAEMKVKLEEENRKKPVLFAIDNIEAPVFNGKATDLLKSEEEKMKLQSEVKMIREKIGSVIKENEDLEKKYVKVEKEIQNVNKEIEKILKSEEEMKEKLGRRIKEKEMVLSIKDDGKKELESLIVDYYECFFQVELKNEEMKILDEELKIEMRKIEDLCNRKTELLETLTCQLSSSSSSTMFVSDKIEEDLNSVQVSVMELDSLLGDYGLKL